MMNAARIQRICQRIADRHRTKVRTCPPDGIANGEDVHAITLWHATRLWNWIDYQEEPEPLWAIMRQMLPFVFEDARYSNSIYFTYAPGTVFAD